MIEGKFRTFQAGEDLEKKRRVKLSGSTVVYADADDRGFGVTEYGVSSGENITIRMFNAGGTFEIECAGAIADSGTAYAADDGKIDASGTVIVGSVLDAATADGDIIEVLPIEVVETVTGASAANVIDGGHTIPFVIQKTWADAAGDVAIYDEAAPFKFRVIDVWLENRAANGSNANTVQLCAAAGGASAVSDAMSLNAVADKGVVRASSIDDAAGVIDEGESLYLNVTKAGGTMGGNAYILAVRIA